MRLIAAAFLALVAALAIWLWMYGGTDIVGRWAAEAQRDAQNAMARSLRALRAGEWSALAGLWGMCLAYGFVHAAGPGHGKLVIGGYGFGVRVTAARLAGLAALSSIAQAFVAIILVSVALALLGWGREQLTALADRTMAPLSYAMIAGVGVWLIFRGVRKAVRLRRDAVSSHSHDHDHGDDGLCSTCGHAHAPTVEQAANVRSWRDVVAVVAVIAIRPCTGAVFLLILTYALGLYWVGIVGVIVMGLGTAGLTAIVAAAAVGARESTLAQAASARSTALLLIGAEILAGAVIALLSLQLLLPLI